MNCPVKEELVDYLFSEVPSVKRAELNAHFAVCRVCRAGLETLKRLQAAAAAVTPAPVSGDFTARLMRELNAQAPAPAAEMPVFKRLFKPAWGLAFGAFAAAMFLGAFFLTGPRAPQPAAAETLYFTDGPATVNNSFYTPAEAGVNAPEQKKTGFVYTDNCATADCGVS